MTTHTLHILCKYIFVLPPITLLLLLAHNLILSRIQPHHRHRRQWEKTKNKLNFFPSLSLSRSTIDTNHYGLYRGLRYSCWVEPKAAMYVFRWKSSSYFNMVQEWQEGKQIVTFFPYILSLPIPTFFRFLSRFQLRVRRKWKVDDKIWLTWENFFPLNKQLLNCFAYFFFDFLLVKLSNLLFKKINLVEP